MSNLNAHATSADPTSRKQQLAYNNMLTEITADERGRGKSTQVTYLVSYLGESHDCSALDSV